MNCRSIRVKRLLALFACAAGGVLISVGAASTSIARAESTPAPSRGTFAIPTVREAPRFPRSELRRNRQGWVQISHIVDVNGRLRDPVIEDSSGNQWFERAAMEAVLDWRFEPATWDGEPVEQSMTRVMITFTLDEDQLRGVTRPFARAASDVVASIADGRLAAARETIDRMWLRPTLNVFEQSQLWLLEFEHARAVGNSDRQLETLGKAAVGGGRWLPTETYINTLIMKTALQLDADDFSGALASWATLNELDLGGRDLSQLAGFIRDVEGIVSGDRIIAVTARLEPRLGCSTCNADWQYAPLRREFSFSKIDGRLDRFELRCDWRRIADTPSEDRSWTIPADWGDCQIIVFGDEGTTFRLMEIP